MIKRYYLHALALLAILSAALRCGEADKEVRPKDALVCVNQECLTQRDIQYLISQASEGSLRLGQREEFLKRWIRDEILYQEAKKQNFDQDEKVEFLTRQKIREIVVNQFIEHKLKRKIDVSEEEARKHFRENRQMYAWDDDYVRVSHIFTQGMAQASLAALLLKEGNKFGDVVQKTSEDADTKLHGGDLGFVRIQDLSPEIAEHASKLMIGQTSPPIATPYGYEIIKVTDRRQKGTSKGFEWAKDEIINSLTLQQRRREIDALFRQAAEKAQIETFDWAFGVSLDKIR